MKISLIPCLLPPCTYPCTSTDMYTCMHVDTRMHRQVHMHMWTHPCTYTDTYTCSHMHRHTCTHGHTHRHVCMHVDTCTCTDMYNAYMYTLMRLQDIYTWIRVHTPMHRHIHMHTKTHAQTHIHTWTNTPMHRHTHMHTYARTDMHTCTHRHTHAQTAHACMHMCVGVQTYTCAHVYTCICTDKSTCIHVHTIHVHRHVYMHTRTHHAHTCTHMCTDRYAHIHVHTETHVYRYTCTPTHSLSHVPGGTQIQQGQPHHSPCPCTCENQYRTKQMCEIALAEGLGAGHAEPSSCPWAVYPDRRLGGGSRRGASCESQWSERASKLDKSHLTGQRRVRQTRGWGSSSHPSQPSALGHFLGSNNNTCHRQYLQWTKFGAESFQNILLTLLFFLSAAT